MENAVRLALVAGSIALLLAGCSTSAPSRSASSGAGSSSPQPIAAASSAGRSDDPSGQGNAGGGTSGNAGSGTVSFDPLQPLPGGNDPGLNGQATLVRPRPGLLNIHDVGASALIVATNGRRVAVQVVYYSGVEPCYALAGVDVTRQGTAIDLVVREGTPDPNAVCIEIAQLKATIVDLGELEPGTYTIHAKGDAPDVTVTVR